MSDYTKFENSKQHVARERQKAKELRKTHWWKNKTAKGLCHYCKEKFPPEELTMDHIVPISRGGKSNKGNLVVCCKECNTNKKYLTPVEILLNAMKKENDKTEN